MATKKLPLKEGGQREVEKIEDINNFRGFYFTLDGEHFKSNFNVAILKGNPVTEFSLGFKLTEGSNVIEHLYNKLKKNEKLTSFEVKAFDEKIDPVKPSIQSDGAWYNFAEVLTPQEVVVEAWTLGQTPTASEVIKMEERFEGYDINIQEGKENNQDNGIKSSIVGDGDISEAPYMSDFMKIN